MPPSLLRQVWSCVEKTQAHFLLQLDDKSLANFLVGALQSDRCLDCQEACLVNTYIETKISLIRDLAQSRLVGSQI